MPTNHSRVSLSLSSIIRWAILLFPFIDIFLFRNSFLLFPGPLGYGPFIAFYLLLPVFAVRYAFPFRVVFTVLLFGAIGASGVLTGIVSNAEFIKVFGSLALPYLYYAYLWKHLELDVRKGFSLYLKGAIFVAALGLLTFVDSIVGFGLYGAFRSILNITYVPANFGIRISSTLGEPTYFANTIAPAGLFAIHRLFFMENATKEKLEQWGMLLTRRSAWIILAALVLTYSTMAFLGLLIATSFILLLKGQIRTLILLPLAIGAFYFVGTRIPEINERIKGILNADQVAEQNVHGSSAILYNHAVISWENFQRNPLFGSGLGSHAAATKRFNSLAGTLNESYGEFNSTDASSMFLRITSELGLFGVIMTFYFLFSNYFRASANTSTPDQIILKLVSAACLTTIILQLLRQGNFILNGFPFFVFGSFYAKQQFRKSLRT